MATALTIRDVARIDECHPELQKLWYACAKDEKCPPFVIVDGARSIEEQRQNVRRGASKTMRSRHIPAKNGWSHATDVAPLVNGKLSWNWKYYYPLAKNIKRIAKELEISALEWGGDWRSFKDGPHWQLSWKDFPGTKEYEDFVEAVVSGEEQSLQVNQQPQAKTPVNNFKRSIPLLLIHEGGFVDHPKDQGKATNMGITIATFRKYAKKRGTVNDLKAMTKDVAIDIYKQHYWDACRCDELPLGVDHAVFDFAVNSGPYRAITFLQSVVGVTVDGIIGAKTLQAINAQKPYNIVTALCEKRMEYLETRPNADTFFKGWEKRVNRVEAEAFGMIKENVVRLDLDEKKRELLNKETSTPPAKELFATIFKLIKMLFGRG